MIRQHLAVASIALAVTACAAKVPRLPEPGDRVRAWTAETTDAGESVSSTGTVGDVVAISQDSVTIRSKDDSTSSLAWSALEALEIDVARGWRALRVFACAMIPLGVAMTAVDVVGDERHAERAILSGIYTVAFAEECFFPGPRWRVARIPRGSGATPR